MAEELTIPVSASRKERYKALLPQLKALLEGESDLVANLANTAAVLRETFGFFWVGFYLMKAGELVLGPFQGPLACTRIPLSKGVCGACASKQETIIVPNVDEFPGHIACSSRSKSEIVVPLVQDDQVKLVLDIDSQVLNDFSKIDAEYLEEVVILIKAQHFST